MVKVDRPIRVNIHGRHTFEQSGSQWLCKGAVLDGLSVDEITVTGSDLPDWLPHLLEWLERNLRTIATAAEEKVKETARTKFEDFTNRELDAELIGIDGTGPRSLQLDYVLSTDLDPYADIYGVWSARIDDGALVAVERCQT
jgi:hypothetical protein